jgi:alpha-galactosidase
MAKVTLIGAGSVEFTYIVLGELFSFPELSEITISLHDIDAQRLDTALAAARFLARACGAHPKIEAHLDRRASLEGADYVINTILVGGYKSVLPDFQIPKRHGLKQTIADTLGVGGIFRALRTIPVVRAICQDMFEVCPEAWLLNYTNPMAMICASVYSGTPIQKVVGLCHSVHNTVWQLADYMGVPAEEIEFLSAGVNHQAFMLRLERDGKNLYPLLDEAIERNPEMKRRVRVEMYRRLGYFPTESSEHSAEYVPWFIPHPKVADHFRVPIDEYLARCEENVREYAEMERLLRAGDDAQLAREMPIGSETEYAPQLIHSMETGLERVIYGNVRNEGLISNLPDGACVEVPCTVTRGSLRAHAIGALPPQLAALNRTFLNVVELTVRAALEGRPEYVRQAAMLDPNTAATLGLDEIWEVCDELTEVHREYLNAALLPQPA